MTELSAEYASPGLAKRLEHEYALRGELDAAWAARPIALSRHDDRLTLVREDPGGEPLDRVLGGAPMAVTEFLRVAIPLTAALRRMHERSLIHKDIKPANILADVANGAVWLTGFGIASGRSHSAGDQRQWSHLRQPHRFYLLCPGVGNRELSGAAVRGAQLHLDSE